MRVGNERIKMINNAEDLASKIDGNFAELRHRRISSMAMVNDLTGDGHESNVANGPGGQPDNGKNMGNK